MKDEINKIIQSISDFYKLDNALKYYLDRHKAQILLDYITNLQEKNERLQNIINELEKWLEENQILYGINQQGFSWGVCGEALDKLKELKGE